MFKKILLVFLSIIFLVGCTKTENNYDPNKIILDKEYYNKGEFIDINADYLNNLTNNNYVLFVYNSFCTLKIPCEDIFKEYMKKYKIDFLSINIDEYKNTKFYNEVTYAPSIIIVKNSKIEAYLDAESDDDLNKYQDVNEFEMWINNYISIKK